LKYFVIMKKNVLAFVFMASFFVLPSYGQTEIGIVLSPLLSVNRVTTETGIYNLTSGGAKVKLSVGAFADLFLRENYYFSTGLFLTPKNITIRYNPDNGVGQIRESFRVQYLQIPATIKLYTNEVALDRRIFIQFGFLNEININKKAQTEPNNVLRNFRLFDFSLLFRGGLDFRLGYNTALFTGISYTRGLTNVLGRYSLPNESLKIKNDLLSLDIGIRF
jgi:hypothetical protein